MSDLANRVHRTLKQRPYLEPLALRLLRERAMWRALVLGNHADFRMWERELKKTMVPLAKFRMDDWPWEALGFSLLKDIAQINAHGNNIRRAIEDSRKYE
jgi:hypothetical protein